MRLNPLFARPSALAPIVMSLSALGLIAGHVTLYGVVRQVDEGTPAHLFQLLMAAQVPIIGYFVVRYLPEAPGRAALVVAAQMAAAAAAFAPIFYLGY